MADIPMDERLLFIDGPAHLYQVFYAIRGLTAPDGEPVNAVYGFARMLHRLRREYEPTHMGVAFDPEGEVFRHDIYEEYKANREPMPDDMARQIPLLEEILEAQGIPLITVEGYEADDVMGTVARRASEEGIECMLVTTDKDAEQLIDDGVSILHVHKDREELLDAEKLEEKKGLTPSQVVEAM
ncbi:MAG: PIN domain-containing protein, partial [Planctomycetota bacterium]